MSGVFPRCKVERKRAETTRLIISADNKNRISGIQKRKWGWRKSSQFAAAWGSCTGLFGALRGDVFRECVQTGKNMFVIFIVRTQLKAIGLGNRQRDFQDVDGIQSETLAAIQWRIQIDT